MSVMARHNILVQLYITYIIDIHFLIAKYLIVWNVIKLLQFNFF